MAVPTSLNLYWGGWSPTGVGTTVIDVTGGQWLAPSVAAGTMTRAHRASGPYIDIPTPSATTVQVASVNPAGASRVVSQFRHNPVFDTFIATGTDITLCRHWHGLAFGTVTNNNSDVEPVSSSDPLNVWCLFRFSTNAGDTTWQAMTCDGTGVTTISDTGVAVAADTDYHMKIRVVYGDGVYFSVNSSAEVRIATTLPVGTATMEPVHGVTKFATGGAETRSFRLFRTLLRVGTPLNLT